MNKKEYAAAIAEKLNITKKSAEEFVNAANEVVLETLAKGEMISIIGFGTYKAVDKKEKTTVNPQTKEKITVPAHKAAKFQFSKSVNKKLNE